MISIRDIWIIMKAILRVARQMVNAELAPLGLTGAEGDILYHLLQENEGLSQEMLAVRLDVDKAAVSRTVVSLLLKGYVRREREQSDARAYRVTATEAAKRARESIERAYEGVYEAVKRDVDEAEFKRLAALLARVEANLRAGEKVS